MKIKNCICFIILIIMLTLTLSGCAEVENKSVLVRYGNCYDFWHDVAGIPDNFIISDNHPYDIIKNNNKCDIIIHCERPAGKNIK